jgi:hypothetical protein
MLGRREDNKPESLEDSIILFNLPASHPRAFKLSSLQAFKLFCLLASGILKG